MIRYIVKALYNMEEKRLEYLIERFKNNEATPDEVEELHYWYNSFDLNEGLEYPLSSKDRESKRKIIWKKILQDKRIAGIKTDKTVSIRRVGSTITWAAACLLILLGVFYFYYKGGIYEGQDNGTLSLLEDIQPGTDKATLLLSDGSVIDLNSIEEGEAIEKAGIHIVKSEEGLITYQAVSTQDAPPTTHTIMTPRGGKFQIVLPDGTKVWLNAASSLTYPSVFAADERKVELTGEGYFEVVSSVDREVQNGSKVPFVVKTKHQEIEVLGTHFNINAYEGESSKTTLLEGKVKVTGYKNGKKSNQQKILDVGQQAKWDGDQLEVKYVNTDNAIDWKNDRFTFSGENIKSIMPKISRWYNVEVEYKGDLSEANFEGSISRYENISEVLRKLELTGTVHFEIMAVNNNLGQERRVVVMP